MSQGLVCQLKVALCDIPAVTLSQCCVLHLLDEQKAAYYTEQFISMAVKFLQSCQIPTEVSSNAKHWKTGTYLPRSNSADQYAIAEGLPGVAYALRIKHSNKFGLPVGRGTSVTYEQVPAKAQQSIDRLHDALRSFMHEIEDQVISELQLELRSTDDPESQRTRRMSDTIAPVMVARVEAACEDLFYGLNAARRQATGAADQGRRTAKMLRWSAAILGGLGIAAALPLVIWNIGVSSSGVPVLAISAAIGGVTLIVVAQLVLTKQLRAAQARFATVVRDGDLLVNRLQEWRTNQIDAAKDDPSTFEIDDRLPRKINEFIANCRK